jgi:multidrug efflux pump subunit AcrA (membrane-fusion protein)
MKPINKKEKRKSNPMKKSYVTLLVAITIIGSIFSGCGEKVTLGDSSKTKKSEKKTLREQVEELRGISGRIEVPVTKLTTGTISSILSVTGELVPRKSVIVKPMMDGRITFLKPIKVGDVVEEGDLIAKIDDRDIEDEITRQEREIEITKEKIKLDESEFAQNEKDLEFDRELFKEGYLNEAEIRKSELNLKRAEIALRQSRLSLEQEEDKLKQVLRKREKVPIKAPISGMVVLAGHLTGQSGGSDLLSEEIMSLEDTLVGTGSQLFGIISQDDFLAQCLVNSKDKAKIKLGQKAKVTVISHKAVEVPGEVVKIDQLQDVKTKAYKVWIKIDETDRSFTSGLFVRANIELNRSENTIVIPKEYLKERDNKNFVQIVVNNTVKDVIVSTGIQQGKLIEITSDVSPGDLLVATEKVIARDQVVTPKDIDKEKEEKEKVEATMIGPSPF